MGFNQLLMPLNNFQAYIYRNFQFDLIDHAHFIKLIQIGALKTRFSIE